MACNHLQILLIQLKFTFTTRFHVIIRGKSSLYFLYTYYINLQASEECRSGDLGLRLRDKCRENILFKNILTLLEFKYITRLSLFKKIKIDFLHNLIVTSFVTESLLQQIKQRADSALFSDREQSEVQVYSGPVSHISLCGAQSDCRAVRQQRAHLASRRSTQP